MSILDNLEVIDGGQRQTGYNPVRVRRAKMAEALSDQIKLLEALQRGDDYRKSRVTRRQNLETDDVVPSEVSRAVSPWWRIDDAGKVQFALRYGSTRLVVKDGKDTFVLNSLDDLRRLLLPLREEVLTGLLDAALASAAARLQQRFTPKKAKKA